MFVTRDLDKNRFSNKTKRDFDVIQSKLYDIKKFLRIIKLLVTYLDDKV